MNREYIPREFIKNTNHLLGAMEIVAAKYPEYECSVEDIIRILPQSLKETFVFQDATTDVWRYAFGEPYTLDNGKTVYGTDHCPPVEWLFRCVYLMGKFLKDSQLLKFLERLGNKSKHLEALIECSPLLVLKNKTNVDYEVTGFGVGNKSIDFLIKPENGVPVLIDAKCRIREVIRKLPTRGKPNPERLLESLQEKFKPNAPESYLQGGWIYSILKFKKNELQQVFDSKDTERLHFIILAFWDKQAYLLCRNPRIEKMVKEVFNLPANQSNVY